jgi:predicted phosphodiesterase
MRVGIITDIHENVIMLAEALKLAVSHKCDELVCLGDIVGYDPRFYSYGGTRSARVCLEMIRSSCRWIVAGNHDLFAAGRFPSFTNGLDYPDHWFKMVTEERKKASRGKIWCYEGDAPNDLGEDELLFLKSLPEYLSMDIEGIPCLFSHYLFPDLTGSTTCYVERNRQLKAHWEFMNHHRVKYSFFGHCHTTFAGFAYPGKIKGAGSLFRAFHSVPADSYNLGDEKVVIMLPPLSGEKGKTGFSIMDSNYLKLNIISTKNI